VALGGYNNNIGIYGYTSQAIRTDSGGMIVCEFSVFQNCIGASSYVDFWSNPDGSGTQYGSSSISLTSVGATTYTYSWASNPVLPPNTTVYAVIHNVTVAYISTDYYLPGEGYDCYFNGSLQSGHDLIFGLNTMQP
jgi:hypothetical protein